MPKKNKMSEKIIFCMDRDMKQEIEYFANTHQRSVSGFVRDVLYRYMRVARRKEAEARGDRMYAGEGEGGSDA